MGRLAGFTCRQVTLRLRRLGFEFDRQAGLAPFQWTVSRLSFSTRDSRRCGNCGSRVAASKRLWESRSDFQGLVSFHNN